MSLTQIQSDMLKHEVVSVASAATCDIGTSISDRVSVTGTTTITSLGTQANKLRFVTFTGALVLTHNATSLILPTAANITTAAGDTALLSSDASGNWTCLAFARKSGGAVSAGATAFGPFTSLASAATTDLSSVATVGVSVTGTTTITSFGTGANLLRIVTFAGVLTLTHNATSLILPGSANITTTAGDRLIAVSDNSGNWTVVSYTRADGTPVVAPAITAASQTEALAGTNNTKTMTPLAVEYRVGSDMRALAFMVSELKADRISMPNGIVDPLADTSDVGTLTNANTSVAGKITPTSLVSNSGSFNGSSGYLARTCATPTNNKKWTLSLWLQRGATGVAKSLFGAINSGGQRINFESNDTLAFNVSGSIVYQTSTTFTNTAGFDHVVIQFDSDNATQADRLIVYKNGTRCSTSTASVSSGQASHINTSGVAMNIGATPWGSYGNSSDYFGGILAEVYFIDGQTVAATSFASGGQPVSYAGTYGSNGAALHFTSSDAMGSDSSGNANTFTNTNVTQSSTVPESARNDLSLISAAFTAASAPGTARLTVQAKPIDAITINTDLIGYVSRDGGTTWTAATLASETTLADGTTLYVHDGLDISGQPSGTSMKWKAVTANAKNVEINGIALKWA